MFLSDEDCAFIQAGEAGLRTVRYVEMAAGFKSLTDSYISRVSTIRDASIKVLDLSRCTLGPTGYCTRAVSYPHFSYLTLG